jgi:hypothetical protein
MVDQRLFNRDMLQSSLFYQIGEAFPGRELHAQRMFEVLILLADDYGRGRFIPADIRTRAFASARTAFAEVSLDDIEKWMEVIEKNGSAYRYIVGEEVYFFMPKWCEYQTLNYRKKSHIPEPPKSFLDKLGLFLSDSGEIFLDSGENSPTQENLGGESENSEVRKERKRKEKKSKGKEKTESSTGRVVQKKSVPIRDRNATTPHTRILKEFDRVHFATHSRDANFAMDIPGENNFALIGKRLKDLLVKGRSEPEILKAIAWFHMKRADWVKGHRFKVFLNNVDRFIDEVAEYEGEKRPMSNPEVDQLHKKLLGRS